MATTKVTSEVLDLNAGRADYSLSATNTVTYVGASGGNQYVFPSHDPVPDISDVLPLLIIAMGCDEDTLLKT